MFFDPFMEKNSFLISYNYSIKFRRFNTKTPNKNIKNVSLCKISRGIQIFDQIFNWSRDLAGNLKFVKNELLKLPYFDLEL